jgi:hypothetical protein
MARKDHEKTRPRDKARQAQAQAQALAQDKVSTVRSLSHFVFEVFISVSLFCLLTLNLTLTLTPFVFCLVGLEKLMWVSYMLAFVTGCLRVFVLRLLCLPLVFEPISLTSFLLLLGLGSSKELVAFQFQLMPIIPPKTFWVARYISILG